MVSALPPIQLQLLGTSAPVPVIETRARTSKPLVLAHDRHRTALQLLLQGPTPLTQVARVAGAPDDQCLVAELRELGLDAQIIMVPNPAQDSAETEMIMVCCLTKRDMRKVTKYIKQQERKND